MNALLRGVGRALGAPSWPFLATALLVMTFALVVLDDWRPQVSPTDTFDPSVAIRGDLERRRASLEEVLDRAVWLETVVPRTISDHRRGVGLSITHPEGIRESRVEEARALMERPSMRRVADGEVALGLHLVTGSTRVDRIVMGEQDGTPYCVRIQGVPEGRVEAAAFPQRPPRDSPAVLLGGCTWVHRYGLPGPSLRGHLARHGLDIRPFGHGYLSPLDPSILGRLLDLDGTLMLTGTYGLTTGTLRQRACAAGSTIACSAEFERFRQGGAPLDGVAFARTDAWRNSLLEGRSRGLPGPDLFTALEEDFGEERFEEFWTSPEPFDAAFEAAFGARPEAWMVGRFSRLVGPIRRGPSPARGAFPTAVALSLVSILATILISRRRRTG